MSERTGNILSCIGLHAGWLTVVKVTKHPTDTGTDPAGRIWIGGYDGFTGWLAAFWLALLAVASWHVSGRGVGRLQFDEVSK